MVSDFVVSVPGRNTNHMGLGELYAVTMAGRFGATLAFPRRVLKSYLAVGRFHFSGTGAICRPRMA